MKLNLAPESDLTRPEMENIKLRLHRVETKEISTVTLGAIANSLLTTRGDIIVRNATVPERLALTVPASPTINFLGVANGEVQPTWKSASAAGAADAHLVQTDASGYTRVVRIGIGTNPDYLVDSYQNDNSAVRISIKNASAGASAQSLFQALNDADQGFQAGIVSSGYTGNAFYPAGTIYFQANSGPLLIHSIGNDSIRFGVASQEWLRVDNNGAICYGRMEFNEMTPPAAGAANTAKLFAQDNGSGKTQLAVRFASGAIQVLATEP